MYVHSISIRISIPNYLKNTILKYLIHYTLLGLDIDTCEMNKIPMFKHLQFKSMYF